MLAGKLLATGTNTIAWDLANATFINVPANKFVIGYTAADPYGMFFSPDGLQMYFTDSLFDRIKQYTLSTAWDMSSAVFLQNFSIATEDTHPQGVFFRADGLKMYFGGSTNDSVYEYDLSAAWDISTAVFLQAKSTSLTGVRGVFFRPDGLKMYVSDDATQAAGGTTDRVYEYDLSTAWDVTTAVQLHYFFIGGQDPWTGGLFFRPDGLRMYVVGHNYDRINAYALSTAWNVSTAASLLPYLYVGSQETFPSGIFFRQDGLKLYICGLGSNNRNVFAYDFV